MKFSETPPDLGTLRNNSINDRWIQLYNLSKESSDSAIKYLFTTNGGGAIAVLTYLGAIAKNEPSLLLAKVSLGLFFIGILFVGLHKAYMVHKFENLFEHYRSLVSEYYDDKTGWEALQKADETKVGNSIAPYVLGYFSFACFIFGSILGALGVW